MALTVLTTRPLQTVVSNESDDFSTKPTVETGNKLQIPVVLEALTIPTINDATASYTLAVNDVTVADSSLFRVGDGIDSTVPGDFPVGAIIDGITDATTITVDLAPTATGTDITVAPPALDVTTVIVELALTPSSSNLLITPKLYLFDGSNAADGLTADGYDNLTPAEANKTVNVAAQLVNLDTLKSNARQPRDP